MGPLKESMSVSLTSIAGRCRIETTQRGGKMVMVKEAKLIRTTNKTLTLLIFSETEASIVGVAPTVLQE